MLHGRARPPIAQLVLFGAKQRSDEWMARQRVEHERKRVHVRVSLLIAVMAQMVQRRWHLRANSQVEAVWCDRGHAKCRIGTQPREFDQQRFAQLGNQQREARWRLDAPHEHGGYADRAVRRGGTGRGRRGRRRKAGFRRWSRLARGALIGQQIGRQLEGQRVRISRPREVRCKRKSPRLEDTVRLEQRRID